MPKAGSFRGQKSETGIVYLKSIVPGRQQQWRMVIRSWRSPRRHHGFAVQYQAFDPDRRRCFDPGQVHRIHQKHTLIRRKRKQPALQSDGPSPVADQHPAQSRVAAQRMTLRAAGGAISHGVQLGLVHPGQSLAPCQPKLTRIALDHLANHGRNTVLGTVSEELARLLAPQSTVSSNPDRAVGVGMERGHHLHRARFEVDEAVENAVAIPA